MKVLISDDDVKEIPINFPTEDLGIVKSERDQTKEDKDIKKPELERELAAHDAIDLTTKKAAAISGIPMGTVKEYAIGKYLGDDDARARVLAHKHNIEDVATAKLMDTLNLIDPGNCEKERDKVTMATGLASILEKVSSNNKGNGNSISLMLYMPRQRDSESFEVIEVG